jgi:hypothetical protein
VIFGRLSKQEELNRSAKPVAMRSALERAERTLPPFVLISDDW